MAALIWQESIAKVMPSSFVIQMSSSLPRRQPPITCLKPPAGDRHLAAGQLRCGFRRRRSAIPVLMRGQINSDSILPGPVERMSWSKLPQNLQTLVGFHCKPTHSAMVRSISETRSGQIILLVSTAFARRETWATDCQTSIRQRHSRSFC